MGLLANTFEINGALNPGQNLMTNLNEICNSCGAWLTFDITTGKWAVIINKPGESVKSFNDSNILGNIDVSGTGLSEAYNKVSVEFPHRDLRDDSDFVEIEIPEEARFLNEIDNTMNIVYQCVNNPIQAQYLGGLELYQSRLDKVIEFRTDFTALGVKAGDIIDVTAEMYGFDQKLFRVVKVSETDEDSGGIIYGITAIEYDESMYADEGFVFELRSKKTDIVSKEANAAVLASDQAAVVAQVGNGLYVDSAGTSQFTNALTSRIGVAALVDYYQFGPFQPYSDYITRRVSLGRTYTAKETGIHHVKYTCLWSANMDGPPIGINKTVQVSLNRNGIHFTPENVNAYSESNFSSVYGNQDVETRIRLIKGQEIEYFLYYRTDWPNAYTSPPGYPAYTPPISAAPAMWVVITVTYEGDNPVVEDED